MGESAMDKMKGKEAVGKVTGDRRTESEGKTDQAKGDAKDAADQLRERAKGVGDSMKRDDR
ncbi:CsbD family protein [Streptomyces albidoflavus]